MTQPQGRKYKFPRRYSRTYCMKTPCKSMGFTQRASCRPYKNCYRGGGAGIDDSSVAYYSSNFKATVKNGKMTGKQTVVSIENGKGTKEIGSLRANGSVGKTRKQKLRKGEMNEILKGNFVPGLWREFG